MTAFIVTQLTNFNKFYHKAIIIKSKVAIYDSITIIAKVIETIKKKSILQNFRKIQENLSNL